MSKVERQRKRVRLAAAEAQICAYVPQGQQTHCRIVPHRHRLATCNTRASRGATGQRTWVCSYRPPRY